MLEHLGPCYTSLLVYVSDHKHGQTLILCHAYQTHRTFTYLRDTSRRRADLRVGDGLYRVNDNDVRRDLSDAGYYAVNLSLREHVYIPVDAEPRRAQLELTFALFACDIQHTPSFVDHAAHLQQQRRFTYARRAAHKNKSADNRPASENTVKLRNAGRESYFSACVKLGYFLCRRNSCACTARTSSFCARTVELELHKRVPRTAGRTFSGPVRRFIAALRAAIYCLLFCSHCSFSPILCMLISIYKLQIRTHEHC